jgi:hypothetical protein
MKCEISISGTGCLVTDGHATGKTPGPMGMNNLHVSASKPGTLGVDDSANPTHAKKQEIDRLIAQYRSIIRQGRSWGTNVAADMLEHWLIGNGADKMLDCAWLRDFSPIIDAEDTNRKRFEEKTIGGVISRIKEGETLENKSYWDRKLTGNILSELYYASGTSVITSRGLFKYIRQNDWVTISGTVEHHWWDPYDWHPGLAAYIPGFGSVKDADVKKLENAGYAQTFGMYGIWHQKFSGKYGIDKGIALFDDHEYLWGNITCGRAPKGTAGNWPAGHDAITDSDHFPLPGLPSAVGQPNSNEQQLIPTPRRSRRRRERSGWR